MAIRYLLLAALVGTTFSAHATPESGIYASTATGTVLLSTTATGQVQTYMPRAVGGFFMFTAPSAPTTAPALLPDSGHFTAPSSSTEPVRPDAVQAVVPTVAEVQVSVPAAVQVSVPAEVQVAAPAEVQVSAPTVVQVSAPADVQVSVPAEVQVSVPAEVQVTAPAEVQASVPVEAILADLIAVGITTDIVANTPAADVSADLAAGPTVLLPQALDINAVPEPATGGLMLAGLAGVGFMARRRRSR